MGAPEAARVAMCDAITPPVMNTAAPATPAAARAADSTRVWSPAAVVASDTAVRIMPQRKVAVAPMR